MNKTRNTRRPGLRILLALCMALCAGTATASADFSHGSLLRSSGVPAWGPDSGIFTIMLWVYAPSVTGANDFFEADDGDALQMYVNLGSAPDSPTEPYFFTHNGEWHYNKDGSSVANPPQSYDISAGWTWLAVTFVNGGATHLYAWQQGAAGNALVHILAQDNFSTLGGSGIAHVLHLGARSTFDEGCVCLVGPVYVYDGVAMTQAQIDQQRQQLAPISTDHLIAYSSFSDPSQLTVDQSGTANWSVHGTVSYSSNNPPVVPASAGGGSSTGGGSVSSGVDGSGALGWMLLLPLLVAAAGQQRRGPQRLHAPSSLSRWFSMANCASISARE